MGVSAQEMARLPGTVAQALAPAVKGPQVKGQEPGMELARVTAMGRETDREQDPEPGRAQDRAEVLLRG